MEHGCLAQVCSAQVFNDYMSPHPWKSCYPRGFQKNQGWAMPSRCPLCKMVEETNDYIFISRGIDNWMWKVIFLKLEKINRKKRSLHQLLGLMAKEFMEKGLCSTIAKLSFCTNIYYLWTFRNDVLFHALSFSKIKLLKTIKHEVKFSLKGRGLKDLDMSLNRSIVSL